MHTFKNSSGRFLILALAIVCMDLLLKVIVMKTFELNERVEWWEGLFGIGRIQSLKMAFGFRFGYLVIDGIRMTIQFIFVLFFIRTQKVNVNKAFKRATTFIVIGWAGNYIDRLILGDSNSAYIRLDYINIGNTFLNLSSLMVLAGWILLAFAIITQFRDFKIIFKRQSGIANDALDWPANE